MGEAAGVTPPRTAAATAVATGPCRTCGHPAAWVDATATKRGPRGGQIVHVELPPTVHAARLGKEGE